MVQVQPLNSFYFCKKNIDDGMMGLPQPETEPETLQRESSKKREYGGLLNNESSSPPSRILLRRERNRQQCNTAGREYDTEYYIHTTLIAQLNLFKLLLGIKN